LPDSGSKGGTGPTGGRLRKKKRGGEGAGKGAIAKRRGANRQVMKKGGRKKMVKCIASGEKGGISRRGTDEDRGDERERDKKIQTKEGESPNVSSREKKLNTRRGEEKESKGQEKEGKRNIFHPLRNDCSGEKISWNETPL